MVAGIITRAHNCTTDRTSWGNSMRCTPAGTKTVKRGGIVVLYDAVSGLRAVPVPGALVACELEAAGGEACPRKWVVWRFSPLTSRKPFGAIGLCRAGCRRMSALRTEARLVTLQEAELSCSVSSFPTRCLFGFACLVYEHGSASNIGRKRCLAWPLMTASCQLPTLPSSAVRTGETQVSRVR